MPAVFAMAIVKVITLTTNLLLLTCSIAAASSSTEPRYRDYMAFGDSITDVDLDGPSAAPPSGSYPVHAGVRAYGIGGTWAVSAADWWPAYLRDLKRRPETAVFLIGINDLVGGTPADTVITSLRGLRRLGRGLGVRVVFGTIVPAPLEATGWRAMERQRRAVNRWIRQQPTYVEYAKPLTCAPKRHLCDRYVSAIWRDVHPNGRGHCVMGATLREWIEADRENRQRRPADRISKTTAAVTG